MVANADHEHAAAELADIATSRLSLRLMSLAFLNACLRGDRAGAEHLLGCHVPDEFFYAQDFMAMRTLQLRGDAAYAPFGPRAMVLQSTKEMAGHIGFHTPPNPEYLAATVGEGIELGYTVIAARRRMGLAEEAVRGMIDWAQRRHGVARFIASIAPHNLASQRLAAKLGFVKVSEQIDDVDGPEDVLLLRLLQDAAGGLPQFKQH